MIWLVPTHLSEGIRRYGAIVQNAHVFHLNEEYSVESMVKLYQPTHDYFRHSFFPDTITHWNALAEEAVTLESTSLFKKFINDLLHQP